MANRRPLRFAELEGGCFVPLSHRLNTDGYFRKGWSWGHEMFHRTIWRLFKGEIPAGHEVDHLCGNRACCNINHLRSLPGEQHTVETNRSRYASRKEWARRYWLEYQPSGTKLADLLGLSTSITCRWIRGWRAA